jgi:hypothetical protein
VRLFHSPPIIGRYYVDYVVFVAATHFDFSYD